MLTLDLTLRRFGGTPTYALTDNGRPVSTDLVWGSRSATEAAPADPDSWGISEATVPIAKAISRRATKLTAHLAKSYRPGQPPRRKGGGAT